MTTSTQKTLGVGTRKVVYRELFASGPLTFLLLFAVWGLPFLVGIATSDGGPLEGFRNGAWIAVLPLMLFPFVLVAASLHAYNGITLYTDRLRVGRHVLSLDWFDPAFVHDLLLWEGPAATGQVSPTAQLLGPPRLLGGGWFVPMGASSLIIGDRWRRGYQFATKNRRAFLAAFHRTLLASGQTR